MPPGQAVSAPGSSPSPSRSAPGYGDSGAPWPAPAGRPARFALLAWNVHGRPAGRVHRRRPGGQATLSARRLPMMVPGTTVCRSRWPTRPLALPVAPRSAPIALASRGRWRRSTPCARGRFADQDDRRALAAEHGDDDAPRRAPAASAVSTPCAIALLAGWLFDAAPAVVARFFDHRSGAGCWRVELSEGEVVTRFADLAKVGGQVAERRPALTSASRATPSRAKNALRAPRTEIMRRPAGNSKRLQPIGDARRRRGFSRAAPAGFDGGRRLIFLRQRGYRALSAGRRR